VELRLKFPPTVDNMPNHAEVAVQAAARVDGVALNYGADSLGSVDVILGRFHDEGVGVDRVAETIFSFGAYVGEVIVRSVGASDEHPMGRGPPMVRLPTDSVVNPIGKAFKRVENGDLESVPYFYYALVEK